MKWLKTCPDCFIQKDSIDGNMKEFTCLGCQVRTKTLWTYPYRICEECDDKFFKIYGDKYSDEQLFPFKS